MIIRYDDAASDFEQDELKFHCRNIFASGQMGRVTDVKVWVKDLTRRRDLVANTYVKEDHERQTEWLIQIPARGSGEFICSRNGARVEKRTSRYQKSVNRSVA